MIVPEAFARGARPDDFGPTPHHAAVVGVCLLSRDGMGTEGRTMGGGWQLLWTAEPRVVVHRAGGGVVVSLSLVLSLSRSRKWFMCAHHLSRQK